MSRVETKDTIRHLDKEIEDEDPNMKKKGMVRKKDNKVVHGEAKEKKKGEDCMFHE